MTGEDQLASAGAALAGKPITVDVAFPALELINLLQNGMQEVNFGFDFRLWRDLTRTLT